VPLHDTNNKQQSFATYSTRSSTAKALAVWAVCLLVTFLSAAITAELIEMPFGFDSCVSKEQCVRYRWGQDQSNPFASARVTGRRC